MNTWHNPNRKKTKRALQLTVTDNRYEQGDRCPKCEGLLTHEKFVSDDLWECSHYEWVRCIQCSWRNFESSTQSLTQRVNGMQWVKAQAYALSLEMVDIDLPSMSDELRTLTPSLAWGMDGTEDEVVHVEAMNMNYAHPSPLMLEPFDEKKEDE